ncbi:MAG: WYL domain-containing protein [Kordia sp.]|nr:MAG: WYL domain-containing protein [Kordia sp.]
MAANKNALIRYKTIDNCLRNNYKQWTLNDLIEACSDALYEYEGKDINVSKRTVQLDIQLMRSDKLGYNAPIEVYDKKYYRYTDTAYSIMNIPVTDNDIKVMSEAIAVLRQFKDFSLFKEMDGVLQRLEDSVYSSQKDHQSIIHLDKNDNLKGLQYLDELYQAILKKVVIKLTYKSFKAKDSSEITFHPYILKEYNNRWFLVGKRAGSNGVSNLALDRIISIDYDLKTAYLDQGFDPDTFYKDAIGVTVNQGERACNIKIWIDKSNAPYVVTKPLHHSQTIEHQYLNGSVDINIKVKINYELERLILGFGESMKVIQPERLKKRVNYKLRTALALYNTNEPD